MITYREALLQIAQIAELKDNWNGYGAESFTKKVIDNAKQAADCLPEADGIFPTGRDSIQFQWERSDNTYIEVEVYENRIGVLFVPQRDYQRAAHEEYEIENIYDIGRVVRLWLKGSKYGAKVKGEKI